jgi:hypothetical protein
MTYDRVLVLVESSGNGDMIKEEWVGESSDRDSVRKLHTFMNVD